MREFDDPELIREYNMEMARAAAKIDFALSDARSRHRDIYLIRKQFIYSILAGLVGACIGFWLGRLSGG